MFLNKGLNLIKLAKHAHKMQGGVQNQTIRKSHVYRSIAAPNKKEELAAEILSGFCWWWILYHAISEPGHLLGEFPYPDPSKWTDEELGIPPDDE